MEKLKQFRLLNVNGHAIKEIKLPVFWIALNYEARNLVRLPLPDAYQ